MTRTTTLCLCLSLAGCTAQIGSGEEHLSHEQHEMRLSAADLGDWATEGEWLVSPELHADDGVSRVGALLGLDAAGPLPALEARGMVDGLPVGQWRPLAATWSEEDHHVAIVDLEGIGDGAQLRLAATAAPHIAHFRWSAVVPELPDMAEEDLDDVGVAREALRTELNDLGIVTRADWGARRTRCTSTNTSKTRMAIHHTVSGAADPERQMRGIQRFHMDSRGWCDVGYHFLVGQDGRVYEGRPLNLLGAHVGGNNTGNIGISFIGCFHSSGCGSLSGSRIPNDASLNAAAALIGRLSRVYGISIDSARLKGHTQHNGQSTSCPGANLLSRLDTLRSRASGTATPPPPAPTPSPSPTPTPDPTPSEGASCTHSFGGTYSDMACSESWQCCDGRWQSRGACGSCACVEGSGNIGCSPGAAPPPAPTPPPGASCTHSFGGAYGNTACSASWQCCDGRWRGRGACGSCFCTESSGETGCGG